MKRLSALGLAVLAFGCALGLFAPRWGGHPNLPESAQPGKNRLEARPFDAPDLAREFYRAKRMTGAAGVDPRAAYRDARARLERMPVYSIRRGQLVTADFRALGASTLDTWSALGPGNIGGRTRALVIHPKKPRIMYAAGVSGGIWKSTNSGNRWQPIADNLTNIAVNVLAMDPADPNVLYAGTGEGYFREEVRGTALPLRGGGVFKSEDAGDSWTRLDSTTGADYHWVNDLVVSHLDSSRIYAATRTGVFRSSDGGATWKRVLQSKIKGGCLDLAARTDLDSDHLLVSCGTLARATVYRNAVAEADSKWKKVLAEGPAMGRTSLAIAPSDQNVVYALSASNVPGPGGEFEQALHAVYRSDQGGAKGTWRATTRNTDARKINTLLLSNPIIAVLTQCGFQGPDENLAMGWYVNTLTVDPRDPDRVWAAGVDFFRSDDGGESWNPVTYWWSGSNNPNFVHADQHGLVFHPKKKSTAFALCDGGIYRTKNADGPIDTSEFGICSPGINRVTWSRLNRSYGVTQFYHGTVYPDGRSYIAGAQDNGTVLGTDSGGENGWVTIQGGDGGYSAIDPENVNVVYTTIQNGLITKSTDGGFEFFEAVNGIDDLANNDDSNFRAQGDLFLFISPLVMDPNESDRLWSGGLRLWRTDDAADNWSAASTALNGRSSALAVAPGDSDLVVTGTENGFIYRSDGATSAGRNSAWESSRPRNGFVSSIAFDPNDTTVVYATYAGFGGNHVWKSTDSGRTWQSIDGSGASAVPDIPVHVLVVDPADSGRLFLGTDLGVLASTDGGTSWAVESTGFATAVTEWLTVNEGGNQRYLFAFTHGRGAWRVPLDD